MLKGVSRLYTLWADTVLQDWLSRPCLLNYINTCTIWFLPKWVWKKSQKHWDTWQETNQVCCSDHSFMFSILEIGQSIHQWQQIFNKMDGKSHMEIICLLPSSVCIRKLIFHPRHAFGLTSYKSLFSDGEGIGTWQLHQYQAMLVGTSGDTRRNFFIWYIHIFSSSTSLFFSETNHYGTVQGCRNCGWKKQAGGKYSEYLYWSQVQGEASSLLEKILGPWYICKWGHCFVSLLATPSFLVSPAGGISLTTPGPESLDKLHKMKRREKTYLLFLIFAHPHL